MVLAFIAQAPDVQLRVTERMTDLHAKYISNLVEYFDIFEIFQKGKNLVT